MPGRIRPRLVATHRRLLVAFARDITEATATKRALVFAPHPDDETLACGATILRKTAVGTPVMVVVAADGESLVRRRECLVACRLLDVGEDKLRFLGYPDGELVDHSSELAQNIQMLIAEFAPDEVFVPSAIDQHPDHRALAAAVESVRREHLDGVTVYAYPVWFWNRWAWVQGGSAARQLAQFLHRFAVHLVTVRPRIVATGQQLAAKRKALDAYRSQLSSSDPAASSAGLDPQWLETFFGREELFFELR
jgi:LmbE family N-acetylglucosaminyl deacetylase